MSLIKPVLSSKKIANIMTEKPFFWHGFAFFDDFLHSLIWLEELLFGGF